MKNQIGWKIVGGMVAAVALSAGASAQMARGGTPRQGQVIPRGSLDNDIRDGRRHGFDPVFAGEIAVDAAQLSLSVRLLPDAAYETDALIPTLSDMHKFLRLAGGLPGRMAVIELGIIERPWSDHPGFLGGPLLAGAFAADGVFEVELPPAINVRGLGALGAMAPGKLVTVMVDLGGAVDEAFASWTDYGRIGDGQRAGTPGSGTLLPQPTFGAGRGAQAQVPTSFVEIGLEEEVVVDDAPSFEMVSRLADPQHGIGAGSGTELRHLTRRSRSGHTAQAQAPTGLVTIGLDDDDVVVDEGPGFEVVSKLADPQHGASAGNGTTLRRPVRGGGHTGRR
jgi:hypothetical protein